MRGVSSAYQPTGLTPLLLQELRARASRLGLTCAVYTLASPRGAPLLRTRCYHMPLQLAALRRAGFVAPPEAEAEAEAEAVGEDQEEEGEGGEEGRLRPMCGADVPRCLELMRARAHRFDLAPIWSEAAWPE